jgi:peptide-methionine (R)-S-oxide reductase
MAKVKKSDAEWKEHLTPEQYAVLRGAGTEPPGTGEHASRKDPGTYHCAGCSAPLFESHTKYESGTGWPSFWEPISPDAVAEKHDRNHGMLRIEVLCASCDGHLGHVFPDGPEPTGRRYCMNSLALTHKPSDEPPEK